MEAALALLDLWLNYMHSIGHVPYAPDFFFVGTGFAGAFLIEVCFRPYPSLLPPWHQTLTRLSASQATYCSDIVSRKARARDRRMQ